MSKQTLLTFSQQKLEEAKRDLKFSVQDFSIPDDKIIELREGVRLAQVEVENLAKKGKGLLGFLGL